MLGGLGFALELAVGGEEPGDLRLGKHLHLGLLHAGRLHFRERVARGEPPAGC
jgi:hypothetical protein